MGTEKSRVKDAYMFLFSFSLRIEGIDGAIAHWIGHPLTEPKPASQWPGMVELELTRDRLASDRL